MAGIAPKYYYLTLALLAVCVMVGFYIAVRLQREVNEDLGPTTEKELLGPLEKAFYSGLMDEAEFRRIQDSMGKLKQDKRAEKPAIVRPKPPQGDAGPEIPPPVEDAGPASTGEPTP